MTKAREQLIHWLQEFSALVGQSFLLNDKNECYMQADRNVFITLTAPSGNLVHINSKIGFLSGDDKETVCKKALELNLFQYSTKGGVISLDPKTEELYFGYIINVEKYNFSEFKNVLLNMEENCYRLRKQLLNDESDEDLIEALAGTSNTKYEPTLNSNIHMLKI